MTIGGVRVERSGGTATEFHDRPMPRFEVPEVWVFEVSRPAVVLGSTQRPEVVDTLRARAAGVEVARRRSGGGAVWLAPGEVTWLDVLVPAGHPRWSADVSRSAVWLGRALAGAVTPITGLAAGAVQVHEGPLRRGPWSDLVCFAGTAPGEATVDGAKFLGISQRRTRSGARFQCAVLHQWDPWPLLDVLDLSDADRAEARRDLSTVAGGVNSPGPDRLVGAVVEALLGGDTAIG